MSCSKPGAKSLPFKILVYNIVASRLYLCEYDRASTHFPQYTCRNSIVSKHNAMLMRGPEFTPAIHAQALQQSSTPIVALAKPAPLVLVPYSSTLQKSAPLKCVCQTLYNFCVGNEGCHASLQFPSVAVFSSVNSRVFVTLWPLYSSVIL